MEPECQSSLALPILKFRPHSKGLVFRRLGTCKILAAYDDSRQSPFDILTSGEDRTIYTLLSILVRDLFAPLECCGALPYRPEAYRYHEGLLHRSTFPIHVDNNLRPADGDFQILRNDPSPATELAVEKDLSSFSRFTRDRFAPSNSSNPSLQPLIVNQLWRIHDSVRQNCRRAHTSWRPARHRREILYLPCLRLLCLSVRNHHFRC